MLINKSYKTELKPNNKQKTKFIKSCGVQRFAYNWGVGQKQIAYQNKQKYLTRMDLSPKINAIKKKEFPWTDEVSKWCLQSAFANLDKAYKNFFRKCKLKKLGLWKGKCGYPKFKTKKKGLGSFRVHNSKGELKITNTHIQLPKIGKVRIKEKGYLPLSTNTSVKVLSATISEKAGRWFVSVNTEQDIQCPIDKLQSTVGVDLGIKTLAVPSKGTPTENPKPLSKNLKKLRKLSRSVSRKVKGSKRRKLAVLRLGKLHMRIANIRKDILHKLTTQLTKDHTKICLEDLNISGMVKNRKLSRAISDVGFYELRRQIEYKGKWYACEMVLADRFYPSSKLCSCCGWKNEKLTLDMRVWTCEGCGVQHDRDRNASVNLERYADELSV